MKIFTKGCCYLFCFIYCALACAEPPFFTDDADPSARHELQIYPYFSFFSAPHTTFVNAPATEIDYGFYPNAEIHLIATGITYVPKTARTAAAKKRTFGAGDTEINIKYKFLQETPTRPAMVVVPTIELPTGNAPRQLGWGKTWFKLPVWAEKNWQNWTLFGGGGYVINSAQSAQNYLYGGISLQYHRDNFLIGGEIFSQGSLVKVRNVPLQDYGASTIFNMGFIYEFMPHVSVIGSTGHSIIGARQWVGYGGLYWDLQT